MDFELYKLLKRLSVFIIILFGISSALGSKEYLEGIVENIVKVNNLKSRMSSESKSYYQAEKKKEMDQQQFLNKFERQMKKIFKEQVDEKRLNTEDIFVADEIVIELVKDIVEITDHISTMTVVSRGDTKTTRYELIENVGRLEAMNYLAIDAICFPSVAKNCDCNSLGGAEVVYGERDNKKFMTRGTRLIFSKNVKLEDLNSVQIKTEKKKIYYFKDNTLGSNIMVRFEILPNGQAKIYYYDTIYKKRDPPNEEQKVRGQIKPVRGETARDRRFGLYKETSFLEDKLEVSIGIMGEMKDHQVGAINIQAPDDKLTVLKVKGKDLDFYGTNVVLGVEGSTDTIGGNAEFTLPKNLVVDRVKVKADKDDISIRFERDLRKNEVISPEVFKKMTRQQRLEYSKSVVKSLFTPKAHLEVNTKEVKLGMSIVNLENNMEIFNLTGGYNSNTKDSKVELSTPVSNFGFENRGSIILRYEDSAKIDDGFRTNKRDGRFFLGYSFGF